MCLAPYEKVLIFRYQSSLPDTLCSPTGQLTQILRDILNINNVVFLLHDTLKNNSVPGHVRIDLLNTTQL